MQDLLVSAKGKGRGGGDGGVSVPGCSEPISTHGKMAHYRVQVVGVQGATSSMWVAVYRTRLRNWG